MLRGKVEAVIGDTAHALMQRGEFLIIFGWAPPPESWLATSLIAAESLISMSQHSLGPLPMYSTGRAPCAVARLHVHVGIHQVFGIDFSNGAGPRQSPEKQV